jgi:UDP-N-acetyl-D-galactosamine dehydrogenase
VKDEYGINLITEKQLKANGDYDAIVLAVAHDSFKALDIKALKRDKTIVYDVKGVLPLEVVDERL